MNFSGEGSEEVKRLRKQVQQQDFRLSHLQGENQKNATQLASLTQENRTLRQTCDAGESKIVQLVTENTKIKEERERQKVVHSNFEQALQQTKQQLQGNEKDRRLTYNDNERTLERRARLAEEEAENVRGKCRILEEQLRSAQASERFHDTAGRKSGDSDGRILALQNEIITLKALLQQSEHTKSPAFSRNGGPSRRPRSSSVSGSSSSSSTDIQQLREALSESVREVEQLKARAIKAEREALKASNEVLALSRASETTIAGLKSQVADLNDEVTFQRDNLIKKLEEEIRMLQGEITKSMKVEAELLVVRSELVQREASLNSAQGTIATFKETVDQLQVDLVHTSKDRDCLKDELVAADRIRKQLQQREKEVESARKGIAKLSLALRKMLVAVTNGQTREDELQSQSFLTIDESTLANITSSNDYEANLVDEIDQLLVYIDEADGRIEFAKVERGIVESNVHQQRLELGRIVEMKEGELAATRLDLEHCMVELEERQVQLKDILGEKEKAQNELQQALDKIQTIANDNTVLHDQIDTLQQQLFHVKNDLTQITNDKLANLDTIKMLEDTQEESQTQLAESKAEIQRSQSSSNALQEQVEDLEDQLQALQAKVQSQSEEKENLHDQVKNLRIERDDLESQYSIAREAIMNLKRDNQRAELQMAKMTLELHKLELSLHDQARESSQCQAILLEGNLRALRLESEQWNSLVVELRQDAQHSLMQLQLREQAWIEEAERHQYHIAALEIEVTVAKKELQEKKAQIEELELDLQAGRTNQQLAEDALHSLVPMRESDLTVLGDASTVDTSNEVYELRIQLDQTRDAFESFKMKQLAKESDLAVAMKEAEELRIKVERLDQLSSETLRLKDDLIIERQDIQTKLQITEELNRNLEANMTQLQENLSSTMRQLAVTQNTVGELQQTIQALEMEKKDQMQHLEAMKEELREAQEGYNSLKEMMESRNTEYWETKEELAEWQERYERSVNEIKIKDDSEERLIEATTRMEEAKMLAEEYLARCTVLEEKASDAQRVIKETHIRQDSLKAELDEIKKEATRLHQVEEQLLAATSLIEQLEISLGQKAQECEDADDKELALRKENKKLAARFTALQVKLEKVQTQGSASKMTATVQNSSSSKNIVGQISASGSAGSLTSITAAPFSASRKRRAPEDEAESRPNAGQSIVITRAIYAPKSATTLVKEKESSHLDPLAVNGLQKNLVKKASFPPSEILANRLLKSPKKLQDRTNLLQPRQVVTAAVHQDTHFLTKLNRFRPPNVTTIQATPSQL